MFCDVTIVSDDTRLGYNEVRYGISGHCMAMPWLVGMKAAKELLLTDREVSAEEAKSLGWSPTWFRPPNWPRQRANVPC